LKNIIDKTSSEIDMRMVQYLVANCRHVESVHEGIYIIEVMNSRKMRWGEGTITHVGR
jgi:hypothetical protein